MSVEAVVLAILVCLAGVGLSVGADGSCPEPSDILPCLCTDDETLGPTMDCSGVQDEPQLAQVFAASFPSPDFYELRISHDPLNVDHRLQSIEGSTLGDVTFERVVISGTQITTIDGYAFDRSKSTLQLLSLDGNRLDRYPFDSIARYTNLTTLLLANNNLDLLPQVISDSLETLDVQGNSPLVVESRAFENSPALAKIDLSRTGQQSLEPGLFTTLTSLQDLDLSDNNLKELELFTIVTAAPSLLFVDLSRNNISFVRHDSIIGLTAGGALFMDDNGITELTKESWQHIFDQLLPDGIISLAQNPLTCGCDLKWVIQSDAYLNLLTDTTKCTTGEMVIFLDPNIFEIMCP